MAAIDVNVKDSPIEGKGVFAARAFKRGEIVMHWHPQAISSEEFKALPAAEQERTTYIDGEYLLMRSPECFVNHSCSPNTIPGDRCDIASRDIAEGEEITSDYALSAPAGWTMVCKCGSKNCRMHIAKA